MNTASAMLRRLPVVAALAASLAAADASAGVLYATGQQTSVPGHDHASGNYVYRIDPATGVATGVSGVIAGSTPAGLGGAPDGRLLGFKDGAVVAVDPAGGTWMPITAATGLNATGFDVTADGRAYIAPFNAAFDTQQLARIDLATGTTSWLGSASAIGDAIDLALDRDLGTAEPFIIALGSVGDFLYGIDLDSYSLVRIDAGTGAAAVIGAPGAVRAGDKAGYSGFAGLTGFDSDDDGDFDQLLGVVNFLDGQRFGGLARFDLTSGGWELIGSNPGLIFFGLGSTPVPEPAALLPVGLALLLARRRRSRQTV